MADKSARQSLKTKGGRHEAAPPNQHGTALADRGLADSRTALLDFVPRKRLFRLDEVLHLPLQLQFLGSRRRWRRRLVRRDPHVTVVLEPGAGRNQAAHRDVL